MIYYMEDPNIGDEIKFIKKNNVFVSDRELKYNKQWKRDVCIGFLKLFICAIIPFILIYIYEVNKL